MFRALAGRPTVGACMMDAAEKSMRGETSIGLAGISSKKLGNAKKKNASLLFNLYLNRSLVAKLKQTTEMLLLMNKPIELQTPGLFFF